MRAPSATKPSVREVVSGIGIVAAWALAGLGARCGAVGASEWALAGYLAAGVFFLGGLWPDLIGERERVRRRGRRWWSVALGVAIGARVAVLPLAPSDDVARYVVEGQVLLHGENPYVVAPADPRLDAIRDGRFARVNHPDLPAIYPPLALAVSAGVSAMTSDERAWKLLALAGDLAAIGFLASALARRGDDPRRLLLYAWNPVVIYAFAGRGHNDLLLVLLLAVTAWAVATKSAAGVGAALAGAVLAKLSGAVLAPILLVGRGGPAVRAFGVILALGFAPLVLAAGDPSRSLRMFAGSMHANGSVHFGIYEVLRSCGAGETASPLATVVSGALLVAFVAGTAVVVRRSAVEPLAVSAVVMTAALLLAPTVHVWYLSWAIVLLPFATSVRLALAVWSVTIGLTLAVEIEQARTGEWRELPWVRLPEYAPVFLALAWGAARAATRRPANPASAEAAPVLMITK